MKKTLRKALMPVVLVLVSAWTHAEDIDLFAGANIPADGDVPNVLIILDNTANWSSAFSAEKAALAAVLNGLPENKFRVGLMMFTETGGGDSGKEGGYVRASLRMMNGTNKAKYANLISSFDVTYDKSNGGKAALAMEEAYRYFSGLAPYAGNNKNKTDYFGNTYNPNPKALGDQLAASRAVWTLPDDDIDRNALASKNATEYRSPIAPGCVKNFIIYISNSAAQDNSNDTKTTTAALASFGGSTKAIPISPAGSQDNMADEWSRFMKSNSLGVTTYTVEAVKATTGQGPGWTSLMKSVAGISNGKYFDVSQTPTAENISATLNGIFSEIQSINSVFASVSLPVSVNTQGTYLNQVYVGMFRPDQNAAPRWAGNLKQYRIGYINNELKLIDAYQPANTSDPYHAAVNAQTGFIGECARSFWTPVATDEYWAFNPQGTCIPPSGAAPDLYKNSNSPDGNVVEKGGQAVRLRSSTTRTLKTCSPDFANCPGSNPLSFSSLPNFTVSNSAITAARLGVSGSLSSDDQKSERDALINWASGLDVDNENLNGATTSEMRPSAHGDVVHSRPVAINFGTTSVPQVVVFYGGNDGVLRAVNGNRAANIGTVVPGQELWSFLAPEFYGSIRRLRQNSPSINFPHMNGGSPKPYGMDGPITAYRDDSHTWIYATMRRGGRIVYAFDVSTPASPVLKWKIGCPSPSSDTGCTDGFTGIGQTWSSPKPLKAPGYGAGASPMLIMGGGYDACEDADPNSCGSGTKGNHIYVLDADTGARLATFDTLRGVVGDVSIVPDSTTGLAKYAYAADLGGNVYRITMGDGAPSSWTMNRIAAFGCDDPASACASNRKFMFAPDVVEEDGIYHLMAGSGDREKPLEHYTAAMGVANKFFMLKDKPSDSAWLPSEQTNCGGLALLCLNSLLELSTDANATRASVDAKKGWYLNLHNTEQVVTSSITLFGNVTFSTHQPIAPAVGACSSNLGYARVYNVTYTTGSGSNGADRWERIAGDGLPPSPVAGLVTLDNGETVPFVIGASPNSPLEASPGTPPMVSSPGLPTSRVYWYIQR